MPDEVQNLRHELMRVGLRGEIDTGGVVPDMIVRSWRRSISGNVSGDAPAERFHEVDNDSILCRAAAPILDRWQTKLAETGTTLLLSDRGGNIVMRRASDANLRRRLDEAHAIEGFDYSEDSVGTNGLGTSIAEKGAVYIVGSQHFNESLAEVTCAAAPVTAPGGTVMGSVSLSASNAHANPLMLTLTREIGQQIEERLRKASRPEDLALAMSFMRYSNAARPTVVMDRESLLANTPGLGYVDVTTHVLLWEIITSHDWKRNPVARLQLNDGLVGVTARRVVEGPRVHYVLHFEDRAPLPTPPSGTPVGGARFTLPGPDAHALGVQRLGGVDLIEGPVGSGRATIALGLHPGTAPSEVTAAREPRWSEIDEMLESGKDVLLRRLDEVDDRELPALAELIATHRAACQRGVRSSRLLMTASRATATERAATLLDEVGVGVVVQPLAETPERIPGLVKRILDTVDRDRSHTMSPAALQSFMQWSWPGNVSELVETLQTLVRDVPGAVIQRRHLPQHLQQTPPRRPLSMIESAEREAIIKALDAAGGNKSEAAELLGMGRTTLYRRLKHFRLDASEHSL